MREAVVSQTRNRFRKSDGREELTVREAVVSQTRNRFRKSDGRENTASEAPIP